jgi:hypothetical protein
MPFLGLDYDNTWEPKSLPEAEYQIRVIEAKIGQQKPEKGSGSFIQLRLEVLDEPEAKDFTHVMMLPGGQDDAKQRNARTRAIQNMLKTFGLDPAAVGNIEELQGRTGWAFLTEETSEEYGMQNRVRKFIAPK